MATFGKRIRDNEETTVLGSDDALELSLPGASGSRFITFKNLVLALIALFFGSTYSVLTYGAKGDNTADDTTAINSAIVACNTAGGGTVVIPNTPSNQYKISAAVVVLSNVTLKFARGTRINQVTQYTPCIQANGQTNFAIIDPRTYGVGNWSSSWVDDSHLDIGVYITNCTDFRVVRPQTRNHALAGVWIDTCSDYSVEGPGRYEGTHALSAAIPAIAFHQYGLVLTRSGATSARATVTGKHRALNTAFGYSFGDINGLDCGSASIATDTYIAQHALYLGSSNVTLGAVKLSGFLDIGLKVFFGTTGTQRSIVGTSTIEIETDQDNTQGLVVAANVGGTLQGVKLAAKIRNAHATPATNGLTVGCTIENATDVTLDLDVQDPVWSAVTMDAATNTNIDLTVRGGTCQRHGVSISAAYSNVRIRGSLKGSATGRSNGYSGVSVTAAGDGLRCDGLVTDTFWTPLIQFGAASGATATEMRNCRHLNFSAGANEPVLAVTDDVVYESNDDGFQVTNVTAETTAKVYHRVFTADGTVAAFNITLPDATKCKGRKLTLTKTDSTGNAVGFAGAGGQTVNGAASKTTATQWASLTVISTGLNWITV